MDTAAAQASCGSDLADGEAGVIRGDDSPDPLLFGLMQPRRRQAQALFDLLFAQEVLSAFFSGVHALRIPVDDSGVQQTGRDSVLFCSVAPGRPTWPYSSVILDIKGELYEATAAYLQQRGHQIRVIDPEAVGDQFDPLYGRYTERQLYASAKYLLYEEGERDPIFIQRGMKMLTQLFLAAREDNRRAGYDQYRLLPYAGQLMNVPINQVAAHLQAISPELATKFLSAAFDPQKDYDEKKFSDSPGFSGKPSTH
jgi:hypothetical protein